MFLAVYLIKPTLWFIAVFEAFFIFIEQQYERYYEMTNLIIHPKDRSTDFLKTIYQNLENKTVLSENSSREEVREMIQSHDRVFMMGHGSPKGLFNVGGFIQDPICFYAIGHRLVPLLKEKKNSVFIWCNADKFVEEHKLEGLYSGMFISEVGEARYCGIPNPKQKAVTQSNESFCEIFSEVADKPQKEAYDYIKWEYGRVAEFNKIASYNNERIYLQS